MANIYIPTNVRVSNYITGSLLLDWDVSPVIEKNRKARYKVWGSGDEGATWELLAENVIRSEASVKSGSDWLAVSSIHPTLGESAKSEPLKLLSTESSADVRKRVAVGIDVDGNFHYLKVDDKGGLVLGEGASITIDTTGLALEAKQDDTITAIQTLQASVSAAPMFEEGALLNVGAAGLTLTLPWSKLSYIHQVMVLQETGSATEFEVQVLATATATSEKDIITKMYSYNQPRLDILGTIPYINKSGLDEIYIKILPNSGTSNNYFVRISGRLAF